MRIAFICVLLGCSAVAIAQDLPRARKDQKFEVRLSTSHHQVVTGGTPGVNDSTPGVALTENGDLLVTYNKASMDGTLYHTLRRSTDGGSSWGPEILQWNASTPDPTLWATPEGRLFIEFGKENSSLASGAAWSISSDSGYTWGSFSWFDSPVGATYFVSNYLNVGMDIYGAGYGPYSGNDGTTDASLWLSHDDATSWTKVSTLRQPGDAPLNESAISRLGETGLLAISRSADDNHTFGHISLDMGRTWSPQIDYTPQVGAIHDPNLLRVQHTLILVGRNPAARQLVAYTSSDEGLTFGPAFVLDTYQGGVFASGYSAMIPISENSALIVYSTNHGMSEIDSIQLHVDARAHRPRRDRDDERVFEGRGFDPVDSRFESD